MSLRSPGQVLLITCTGETQGPFTPLVELGVNNHFLNS